MRRTVPLPRQISIAEIVVLRLHISMLVLIVIILEHDLVSFQFGLLALIYCLCLGTVRLLIRLVYFSCGCALLIVFFARVFRAIYNI